MHLKLNWERGAWLSMEWIKGNLQLYTCWHNLKLKFYRNYPTRIHAEKNNQDNQLSDFFIHRINIRRKWCNLYIEEKFMTQGIYFHINFHLLKQEKDVLIYFSGQKLEKRSVFHNNINQSCSSNNNKINQNRNPRRKFLLSRNCQWELKFVK